MKKQIIFTIAVSLLSFGVIDSAVTKDKSDNRVELIDLQNEREEELIKIELEEIRVHEYHQQQLDSFLNAIGFRESSNRYDIVNRWGYMGKYQFGRSTLKGLGYDVSKKEFLSNHDLQEEAMMALLNHNKEKLQKYIDIFDGKNVNGIYITESGILAAAHLGGQGSVKRFFKNGRVFRDGNGTKITSYMEKFSGYDIALN